MELVIDITAWIAVAIGGITTVVLFRGAYQDCKMRKEKK